MRETFIVLKRGSGRDARRNVYLRHGHDESYGSVDFMPLGDLTLADIAPTFIELQSSRDDLAPWVSAQNDFDTDLVQSAGRALTDKAYFLQEEILGSKEKMAEMANFGMTAWIDADDADAQTYFELVCHEDELSVEVELAWTKVYFGTVELVVIFHSNVYYAKLRDLDGSEHAINTKQFPEVSRRGTGLQLKTYAEKGMRKLTLWHVLDNGARAFQASLESKCSEGERDGNDLDEGANALVDESRLWNKSTEAFRGGYTQTYVMMRATEPGSVERRAFFRYGQWCYGGCLDMDHEVSLSQVPHVLRKFQKQQGRLGFLFEVKNLPKEYHFTPPMKHLAMTVAFLEEEIGKAEQVLTDLNQHHARNGMESWIDEENGQQYFELQTAGVPEQYRDVELMASKTYFQEVVLIVLYFESSFYVTLSPSVDDQPLLDMSFPDVSTRGRAFQVASYNHPFFKKLMLWQAQKSVWETANRAVLEQRRKEAEAKAARRKQIQEERERETRRYEEEAKHVDDGEYEDEEEIQHIESKTDLREANEGKTSPTGESIPSGNRKLLFGSMSKSTPASSSRGGVKARHHLKPLDGASFRKIQKSLPKLGSDLDAPWDARGRPKALFNAD